MTPFQIQLKKEDDLMPLRSQLRCTVHPAGSLPQLKYVVICSFYRGQLLLSRHRQRSTWEFQGGHIEAGETALEAARRELYEESGVTDATLLPVCDYCGYNGQAKANGAVFRAEVHRLGPLPDSEIQEVRLFDALPENLTYPHVAPVLLSAVQNRPAGGRK